MTRANSPRGMTIQDTPRGATDGGRMRRCCPPPLLLALLVLAAPAPAAASRPTSPVTRVASPSLESASGARLRSHVSIRYAQPPQQRVAAWSRFVADAGAAWQASWDQATGVPSRI